MKQQISVLLPTYNCNCVELVTELHRQCVESKVEFEILVADDASPDRGFVEENKAIEHLNGVFYFCLEQNKGRAEVRNYLAREAKYEWIIFIDGDRKVAKKDFIQSYLQQKREVIAGGITIDQIPEEGKKNLRYSYEIAHKEDYLARNRQKNNSQNFTSANFLIRKNIILAHPFKDYNRQYGYEDVLFGKELHDNNIDIIHIDNPIAYGIFENNKAFLEKTEEGLQSLYHLSDQIKSHSKLLSVVNKIEKYKLSGIFREGYRLFGNTIKQNLLGNNPSIFWFNIYKLMYYLHYKHDQPC